MGGLKTICLQIESPIHIATPFFFVLIGIEVALLPVAGHHEARKGYSSIDTAVFKLATMVLFVFLWTYVAPWQLATNTWWSWLSLPLLGFAPWTI